MSQLTADRIRTHANKLGLTHLADGFDTLPGASRDRPNGLPRLPRPAPGRRTRTARRAPLPQRPQTLRAAPPQDRRDRDSSEQASSGPGVLTVAAVTLANGGDNIGVYVPVFTTTGAGGLLTYALIFLILVALWCVAGYVLARRPLVARALSRWGHILLPIVLIGIGMIILIEGHAFGL